MRLLNMILQVFKQICIFLNRHFKLNFSTFIFLYILSSKYFNLKTLDWPAIFDSSGFVN